MNDEISIVRKSKWNSGTVRMQAVNSLIRLNRNCWALLHNPRNKEFFRILMMFAVRSFFPGFRPFRSSHREFLDPEVKLTRSLIDSVKGDSVYKPCYMKRMYSVFAPIDCDQIKTAILSNCIVNTSISRTLIGGLQKPRKRSKRRRWNSFGVLKTPSSIKKRTSCSSACNWFAESENL